MLKTRDGILNSSMEDLLQLIRSDSEELERQFSNASIQGRGTPQEIAGFRENALQDFLRNYFPFPYRVSKGGILDRDSRRSASVDCVLIHPDHPYTIDRREKFKIILADGVNVAFEVKPDISVVGELHRGLEQGLTVKALRRKRAVLIDNESQARFDYSERVPYFIFAMRAKSDVMQTGREVLEFYESRGVAPLDQAEAILINGVGILANYPVEGTFDWATKPGGRDRGWFFEEWACDTLAGLLFKTNKLIPPQVNVAQPILDRYLERVEINNVVALG